MQCFFLKNQDLLWIKHLIDTENITQQLLDVVNPFPAKQLDL